MMHAHNLTDLGSLPNLKINKTNGLFQIPDLEIHLEQNLENLDLFLPEQNVDDDSRTDNKDPIPKGIGSHSAGGFQPLGDGLPRPNVASRLPIILALDLGTTMGWAIRSDDGSIISGSHSFKPHRFEGGGMRFLRFKQWLTEIKNSSTNLDQIYFEEVRRHTSVDAAHAYGGFMAHLTAWCEHHQIPYGGVPVGTIKKFITGKGNADKQAVINAVTARGFQPADDNEADAIALLLWAIKQQQGGSL